MNFKFLADNKPKKQEKKQEKPKEQKAPEPAKPAEKVDYFADVPKR